MGMSWFKDAGSFIRIEKKTNIKSSSKSQSNIIS